MDIGRQRIFVTATSIECEKNYKSNIFTFFWASVISVTSAGLVILEAINPMWNQVLRMERPFCTGFRREMTKIRNSTLLL